MQLWQVSKKLFIQCLHDRCMQLAASLAYATLLALIPMTVLLYKISVLLFAGKGWQLQVQEYVINSLSPATAEQLRQFMAETAQHATSMTLGGVVMLSLSILAMMHNIDTGLNRIWKGAASGYNFRRFLVYLGLLIFTPMLISATVFLTTYVASLPLLSSLSSYALGSSFLSSLSFILLWIAFTVLYKWVPRCFVQWRFAFYGASFAVALFEIAKQGFALYVSIFHNYEILYGALAAIPLLLIWIYLSWLIVLIGAEIAHYLQYQH